MCMTGISWLVIYTWNLEINNSTIIAESKYRFRKTCINYPLAANLKMSTEYYLSLQTLTISDYKGSSHAFDIF